jgi:hypothetical protein
MRDMTSVRTSEERASSVRLFLLWLRTAALALLTLSLLSGPRRPPFAPAPCHSSVGACLWGYADGDEAPAPVAEHPAFDPLFSVAGRSGIRSSSPARRRSASVSPIAREGAIRKVALDAADRSAPARASAQASVSFVRPGERIESLSESILPNAAFERSLRAASFSSGVTSGHDLFPYSPSTISFQAPADLRTFSYTASPLKLGRARLTALLGSTDLRGRQDTATVKTSLVVPAFRKRLTLNVRGGYDRLHRPETTILPYYPYDASSAVDEKRAEFPAGDGASPIAPPVKSSDTESYTYGAGAAVPVAHDLNLGIGYTAQRLSSAYGVAPNALPANRKDAYSGSLTFAPRGGKSTLSIIGGQSRYSDDAAPNAAYTERRGDVVFSVKF